MIANQFRDSLNQRLVNTDNSSILQRLFRGKAVEKAQIQLSLSDPSVELGGEFKGEIKITAGKSGAHIEDINICVILHQDFEVKGSGEGSQICQMKLSALQFLAPGSQISINFKQKLPYSMPLSGEKTKYYVVAGWEGDDLASRTGPELQVLPNKPFRLLQEALQALGFRAKNLSGEFINQCQLIRYLPAQYSAQRFSELKMFVGSKEKELSITLELMRDQAGKERKQVRFVIPCASMHSTGQVAESFKRVLNEI